MAPSTPSPAGRPPGPVRVASAAPASTGTTLGVFVVVMAALYIGRSVFVPLALAVLISFALAPLVLLLRRGHLGRIPSVILAVLVAVGMLGGVAGLLGDQLINLADNLPAYQENLRTKIRSLKEAAPGGGLMERTTEVLRDLGSELSDPGAAQPAGTGTREPVPVRIEPPPATPLTILRNIGGPVMGPLGTAGIVFVFVVFILIQREDLRDRLIRLAGAKDLRRTTEALDEAATRVTRYLLTQLTLNVLYGVPVGVGLALLGVPNPVLWGVLAAVLRFIPYLGPVIAASFPIALSVAVDPGWTLPLMTLGLFLVLELFSNNVLEPWLYGSSTGLSPFAVVLAAIFWTTLWGPVGLLLATPLTVCLVVLGRYVPQLEFLDVLLGNGPVLSPPARIYQRLLARDPDEAAQAADEMAGERPVAEVYDAAVIPALRLAEDDRARGALDQTTLDAVRDGVEGLAEYFADPAAVDPPEDAPAPATRVLCIAARSTLDEAAALLLADLLGRGGVPAEALPCEAVHTRRLRLIPRRAVDAVVLCYLNPGSGRHAQRLTRRLRAHFGPATTLVVGFWGAAPGDAPSAVEGADATLTRLEEAAARLVPQLAGRQEPGADAAPLAGTG